MKSIREYRSPRTGEIAAFLSRHTSQIKQYSDELRFRPCPCCKGDNPQNPCIQINQKSGLWRCFKCGKVGNWFQLTKHFGEPIHESDRYSDRHYQAPDGKIIEKYLKEIRRPVANGHYPELLKYCLDRGISKETLNAFRVSSKGERSLRFPIYDLIDGRWQIVNMKVKSIDPESTSKDWFDVKGGSTDLFIGNHLFNPNDPDKVIYIFEGQFDAMTAWELGLRNVFSLPNGSSNVNVGAMLRWIPDDFKIILSTDMDQSGDKCAERFYSQLPIEKIVRLKLPKKDLNEWLMSDPFLDKKQVLATITNIDHFFLEPTGFLKIDLKKEVSVKSKIVSRTGFELLDERLGGGLFEGQTTGLLGPSGQGKTTFINQLGISVAANQIPCGLISVEGSRDALAFKLKESIVNGFDESQWDMIERNLLVSQLFGHRITEEELYKEVLRLIENGSRLIIIDNLDHIFRGDSQKKSDAYGMLIDYAIKNKVHIIVIWQPHKIDRDAWVNSGSQKGFSMSLQDADNYLSLNRTRNGICIEIEKNRQKGISKEESKIFFEWDQTKRIYTPENRFTNQKNIGKLIRLK